MSDSGFTPSYIKTEAPVSPGRQSFKVTLGVIPDFTYEKGDGFRIGTVTEGRAASKAGLKEGDIITLMKGKKINNIYDYMSSLGELNAGERIDIEIIRDGQKILLTINL
jgi:S1-C subfamily serine protease